MRMEPTSASGASGSSTFQHWLILTQYYPPEIGAPQIRLRCFARELLRQSKSVSVMTAMPNYPTGKIFEQYRGRLFCEEEIDGVHVRHVWAYAATGKAAFARLLNYCCFAITALPLAMLGARPDVIFVEAQPLPLGIVALLMKILRGVPYIYNVPDLQVDVAKELGFLRWKFLLGMAERLETLLLRNAMKVSTVTNSFMKHFESRGISSSRITFLPNGADTEFLRPIEPSPRLRDAWGLEGKLAFVYVGTHAYYHGLDTLVQAAELLKTNRRIRIVMVGDGPERERLRKLAIEKGLDNIIFARVPYEGTAELYSVAYASVAALRNISVAQGMRLSKIFPALSCGVPVLYSGKGEAAELLTRNQCGITVTPEDANALAHAMSALANDPWLRDQLGRNGRSFVEHAYSWATIVERWLQEIEDPLREVSPALSQSGYAEQSVDQSIVEGVVFGEDARCQVSAKR